jgi:hypothetical protein
MSSIPSLGLLIIIYYLKYADKGFAPFFFDHESNMLLLHQSTCKAKVSWTLIITVMSSTLYQLSYSLKGQIY